ncbi:MULTISPECIES: hypothetical protein [Streptomyces]|uniref:Uncharacterized protein n=1 Tax=Streptomyces venezuelae TaxID=54571 RepID=A0A5P2BEA3_STRVZ|nr:MULTISPECIES: hypothetical protein [Streptomyces]NEA06321.1 hypothetical protein [Streptomyces sp. SID10116]MYY82602.1 hypothetical protein [Streptomyces sp. SID335]MYZ15197.1 hypothetical protein [Streptomyces sp. SID337]NDZ91352.1 hypothetical protein [Streptomyces sp. SID10115]NEB50086.1 hypothetical protein [Streptomyces sp. SID339]
MGTPTEHPSLLPITHATLAADPRLLAAARDIGARHGFDYTDDASTAALLRERRKAVRGAGNSAPAWLGALAIIAAICWPLAASGVPSLADRSPIVRFGPGALLLTLTVWLWALVWRRWKRELRHPLLVGYREVIAAATAYGAPVTQVPDWLVGRSDGGTGKGVAPIPSYEFAGSPPPRPDCGTPNPNIPIPAKSAAVSQYEARADEGGWHDEAGWILLIAGGIGIGWGHTQQAPVGYLAGALIPLAIVTWLAGHRQGNEKRALREEALAYVRALAAAQAAGASAPELSTPLRKLYAEDSEERKE